MATVTCLTSTLMDALPSGNVPLANYGSADTVEITVFEPAPPAFTLESAIYCYGTSAGLNFTFSEVMFDTRDFGPGPNMIITGINFLATRSLSE
jgi:hypothetical protein